MSLYLICTPWLGYISERPTQPASYITRILIKNSYFIFLSIFQPKEIFLGVHIFSEGTKSPLKKILDKHLTSRPFYFLKSVPSKESLM